MIADDLHDLGLAYAALHREGAARAAFTAAIDVLERGAGKETPRVAYAELELSRLYRQQGNAAAADADPVDPRPPLLKKARGASRTGIGGNFRDPRHRRRGSRRGGGSRSSLRHPGLAQTFAQALGHLPGERQVLTHPGQREFRPEAKQRVRAPPPPRSDPLHRQRRGQKEMSRKISGLFSIMLRAQVTHSG